MISPAKGKWRRRLKRLALVLPVVVLVLVGVIWSGLADRWARGAIVGRLEKMTGGRVELREFRFHWFSLRAELDGLTIRGREPEGTPPLFHADHLLVDVRVVSFLGRRIGLDEVRVDRPSVHVRFDEQGRSNVPAPVGELRPAGKPWRERLFDLAIGKLRLNDGQILLNATRIPLVAEGGDFRYTLDLHTTAEGQRAYQGEVGWEKMTLAARRYLPFRSHLAAKFTIEREAFTLSEFRWKLPHSELHASAALASFAKPAWTFRYQGTLALADLRTILRKPNTPGGFVDFSGEGHYAERHARGRGSYAARDVVMPYMWFHTTGIASRGSYRFDNRALEVPDFQARVLGGNITGRVDLAFPGMEFRVESRARGINLAALLAAVHHDNFPVNTLHWNGGVDVDSLTTWSADFKHVQSRGQSLWSPPAEARAGEVPAAARLNYHYVMDQGAVELQKSEISTPTSRLEMHGRLGARDSGLEVKLDTQDLLPWNDFINRLRGADAEPRRIVGGANWQGRVTGRLARPTFAGHVKARRAAYGNLYWDELEGDLTYSPDQLRLARMRARRGNSTAVLELRLDLDDWRFRPENAWTFAAELVHASTDELQGLFGTSFPARGTLTGQFHGRGTRRAPELTGLFDLAEVEAWRWRFDRARGQLTLRNDEVRIARAELRLATGRITGNYLYRVPDQQIAFEVTGADIPLERVERIQTERIRLGGQLSFQLSGSGPLRAPTSQGTLRLADLRAGQDTLGSIEGTLRSDGRRVHADLNSSMATGKLTGKLDLTLSDDYPVLGEVTAEGIDLDAFIVNALRLKALTGHSRVDGRFKLTGALGRPETLTIEADLSRLNFDYQYVKLENDGPLRLAYRREEVRIEQAHIRGPETDFRIAGYARFAADRQVNLSLGGTVNLRLLGGFLPELDARGAAHVNAAISGTLDSPRINGKLRLANAAASYGDFPAGLSEVNGEFVFDRSRLLFEDVSAQAGGGRLLLGGTVAYGEGAFRYDLSLRAARVRLRYPEGMSWLAGGTLRLSGTTRAGLLSGRVVVERVFMAEGFDLASLMVASSDPIRAPRTDSPYLRNLQFDVEAVSSPDARMEWSGARLESEAGLRLRGTWEHPILLGHIHLLSGEMAFRGSRYRLERGELNFANPFRFDPVLNVEATTTIRQYAVTLAFTGPASRLNLAYRSDPPLPASDIIALLALGRTGEESELRTAPGQAPEAAANMLLSEAISSQIGGRIERLFGVSRFKVDPFLAGTGSEQNAPARITIEQQLTRDLVVTYITNVTSAQQQVIQVEYAVNRDISIVALRDQNGTFGLDVKFKKRFK